MELQAVCRGRLLACLILPLASGVQAAQFTVNNPADDIDANPGDGLCASAAGSCTLRAAILESNALPGADEILLPAGDYPLSLGQRGENAALQGDLDILDDLHLRGAGREATRILGGSFRIVHILPRADGSLPRVQLSELSLRDGPSDQTDGSLLLNAGDLQLHRVGLSAGGQGSIALRNEARLTLSEGLLSDNHRALFNSGGWMSVSDSTFRNNGNADSPADGAALNNQRGYLKLSDSQFEGNLGSRGGALYNGGELRASGLDLRDNRAHWGGALYNAGSAYLQQLEISGNRADLRSSSHGGGITSTGDLYLRDSALIGNRAEVYGGAIHINGGSARLLRLRIADNQLNHSGGDGGGVMISQLADAGRAELSELVISANSAPDLGGGVASKRPFVLSRSQLSGNRARRGGGLYSSAVEAQLDNSTLAGNEATDSGGGLYLGPTRNSYALELRNVTLAGNTAPADRAGNLHRHRGELRLASSLIAGAAGGLDCVGAVVSLGHNLDSDGSCALSASGDLPNTAPQLGPLADNGGASQSRAPAADSPAVDAGADCAVLDQRGHYRSDGRCDIGAHEVAAEAAEGGQIAFASADYSAPESAASSRVAIVRSGASQGPASVRLHDFSAEGEATPGEDYAALADLDLRWGDGESGPREVLITLHDDADEEGHESIALSLLGARGAALAAPSHTTLTLLDDETRHGDLSFGSAAYSADEADGSLTIEVARANGSRGEIGVAIHSEDLGASADEDFQRVQHGLTFSDGQELASFSVLLLDDARAEGDEDFKLILSKPTGGAQLGNWPEVVVSIVDDDQAEYGSIAFVETALVADESAAELRVQVRRSGGSDGAVSVDYASSNMSAAAGEDYQRVGGTLQFAEGQDSAEIVVALLDDGVYEGDEQFSLRLSNPQGGASLGVDRQAVIDLRDDDPEPRPGRVRLQQSAVSVDETAGTLQLLVERVQGSDGAVSVDFATLNDSALAGEDFIAHSGTLQFAEGVTQASISIVLLDDQDVETDESFSVQLSRPAGGASLEASNQVRITLRSDDQPAPVEPGALGFEVASVTLDEDVGAVRISVLREQGSDGAVSVEFSSHAGSATAGADYAARSGPLLFAAGETQKTIDIPIVDDSLAESDEGFEIRLGAVGGGARLGAITVFAVLIRDDDPPAPPVPQPGVLAFEQTLLEVDEGAGVLNISVLRSAGSDGVVTVDYTSADQSAQAGDDYAESSGTLRFDAGETRGILTLTLIDDADEEAVESLQLILEQTTGGATIGAPARLEVRIAANDSPADNAAGSGAGGGGAPALWGLLLLTAAASRRQRG